MALRAITALYSELDDAARAATPGTVLALSTPVLHGGAAGTEARRVDLAGLAPSQAWRSVGLDLQAWPTGPNVPIVLRGVELSTDPLAHDLATSPDLDAKIASRPHRGMLLTIDPEPVDPTPGPGSRAPAGEGGADGAAETDRAAEAGKHELANTRRGSADKVGGGLALSAVPLGDGLTVDEPLGHALAALDAQWVILAVPAIAGHEERLRKFASVLRPSPPGRLNRRLQVETRKTTESPFGPSATRRKPSSRLPTTRLTRSGWLDCWMPRPRQVSRISDATSASFPRPPPEGVSL